MPVRFRKGRREGRSRASLELIRTNMKEMQFEQIEDPESDSGFREDIFKCTQVSMRVPRDFSFLIDNLCVSARDAGKGAVALKLRKHVCEPSREGRHPERACRRGKCVSEGSEVAQVLLIGRYCTFFKVRRAADPSRSHTCDPFALDDGRKTRLLLRLYSAQLAQINSKL